MKEKLLKIKRSRLRSEELFLIDIFNDVVSVGIGNKDIKYNNQNKIFSISKKLYDDMFFFIR